MSSHIACNLSTLFKSRDNKILDLSILNEFIKALLINFSLEKFKSIFPSTLILSIIKTFSSEKHFEYETKKNIFVIKNIKKYFFILFVKNFSSKYFFMETHSTYIKSGVNMANIDKLVNCVSKNISILMIIY